MAESPTFKTNTIAKVLYVSRRRIRQLVSEGMPRVAKGKYDLSACVQWYTKYKTSLAAQSSKIDQARLRKLNAEAKMIEIRVTAMEEKLIPAAVVKDTWERITETIRARLLKIPAAVAPDLDGVENHAGAQEIIKNHVYTALDEIRAQLRSDLIPENISKSRP